MNKKNDKTFLGINLSSDPERANYLARIFATFYENLLEIWLETKGFESKGRPTVYDKNGKYRTYDYTLKKNSKFYIVEAKCWLAFNNFYYLRLKESLIREWGAKDNFTFFCNLGTKEGSFKKYTFKYANKDTDSKVCFNPYGKILIWPIIINDEVKKIKDIYQFSDIFSIEDAINDMKNRIKKNEEYFELISKYRVWTEEFFRVLTK